MDNRCSYCKPYSFYNLKISVSFLTFETGGVTKRKKKMLTLTEMLCFKKKKKKHLKVFKL